MRHDTCKLMEQSDVNRMMGATPKDGWLRDQQKQTLTIIKEMNDVINCSRKLTSKNG